MTKDHIVPRSKCGSNTFRNLQTACTKCNNKKGCMMPYQYERKLLNSKNKSI